MSDFDAVVSLGAACQATFQIEQRFKSRAQSPFDWLVTPLDAIEKVFDTDGRHLMTSFQVVGGTFIRCTHYGVTYHHELPRDADELVTVDIEAVEKSRSKLLYKYQQMCTVLASSKRALFVRVGGHHDCGWAWPYIDDGRILSTADLNRLVGTISATFPQLDFEVAFAYFPDHTTLSLDSTLDRRVHVFRLEGDDKTIWQGNVESWKPVFDKIEASIMA